MAGRPCAGLALFASAQGTGDRAWLGTSAVAGKRQWRKRLFKALSSGYKPGYRALRSRSVIGKEVTRPTIGAMQWEETEFVDGGLRSGRIATEEWRLDDGKSSGV